MKTNKTSKLLLMTTIFGLLLAIAVAATSITGTELVEVGDTATFNGVISEGDVVPIIDDWETGTYQTRYCAMAHEMGGLVIAETGWEACTNSYDREFNATFSVEGTHHLYVVMIQATQEWISEEWVLTEDFVTIAVDDHLVFAVVPIQEPSNPTPPSFWEVLAFTYVAWSFDEWFSSWSSALLFVLPYKPLKRPLTI